jgi:phospholipid/cholesterol/gamma-HCH transport system substrate-binding protein
MRAQPNYALVGAFVLGLGGVAIALGLWLASGGVSFAHNDRYVAWFDESVTGLSRGAPVRFRGVPVGAVRELTLDRVAPDRVRVLLEVARGTPITRETFAAMAFQGLTGIASVELSGGGHGAPPLTRAPGEPYPVIRTAPSTMRRLEDEVTALVGDLGQAARRANALLDDDSRVALHDTIADIRRLAGTLAGRSDEIDAALRDSAEAVRRADEATARLPGLVGRLDRGAGAVERAAEEARRVGVATREAVGTASGAASEAARTLQQLDGESLHRLVLELTAVAATLERVSGELERSRGALLGGQQPPPGPGE